MAGRPSAGSGQAPTPPLRPRSGQAYRTAKAGGDAEARPVERATVGGRRPGDGAPTGRRDGFGPEGPKHRKSLTAGGHALRLRSGQAPTCAPYRTAAMRLRRMAALQNGQGHGFGSRTTEATERKRPAGALGGRAGGWRGRLRSLRFGRDDGWGAADVGARRPEDGAARGRPRAGAGDTLAGRALLPHAGGDGGVGRGRSEGRSTNGRAETRSLRYARLRRAPVGMTDWGGARGVRGRWVGGGRGRGRRRRR